MKVLVVKDEQGLAESITECMVKNSYVCETAAVLLEADETSHLDCVTVDLTLPGGNGVQLIVTAHQLSLTNASSHWLEEYNQKRIQPNK